MCNDTSRAVRLEHRPSLYRAADAIDPSGWWLGWALVAAAVLVLAAGSAFWMSRKSLPSSGPRADVILAAAAATTDPLERTLLLLELGDAGNDRRPAADLALQAASRPVPYALLRAGDRPPTTVRFTPDGSGIVVGFDDGTLRFWRSGSFQAPMVIRTQAGADCDVCLAVIGAAASTRC